MDLVTKCLTSRDPHARCSGSGYVPGAFAPGTGYQALAMLTFWS